MTIKPSTPAIFATLLMLLSIGFAWDVMADHVPVKEIIETLERIPDLPSSGIEESGGHRFYFSPGTYTGGSSDVHDTWILRGPDIVETYVTKFGMFSDEERDQLDALIIGEEIVIGQTTCPYNRCSYRKVSESEVISLGCTYHLMMCPEDTPHLRFK